MATPTDPTQTLRIDALRRFNRFYTRRIGVLHEGLLSTKFSLTESRLLWELAHRDSITATELARELDLDGGYLSRLLGGFKQRGLVKTLRSKDDGRHLLLTLTAAGRKAFAPLDERSRNEVGALLAALAEPQQQQLLQALASVESLLGDLQAHVPAKELEIADPRLEQAAAADLADVGMRPESFDQERPKALTLCRAGRDQVLIDDDP